MGITNAGIERLGAGHSLVVSHRQRNWLILVIPAVAAWLLGGYQLGKLSLWRDEAYSLEAAGRSYGHIFALLHHADAVNGTYYLFLHMAIALLGTSEAALRLPSLLAIAGAAATTAALGRLLAQMASLSAPWLTGLLAGLLFAVAPQATRYAQDARSYAIVTMLVTIGTYLLVRAMVSGAWRWWAGYAAAIALAGFFNLFAVLVIPAHGLTVLITHNVRRRRVAGAASSGLADSGSGSGADPVRPRRWLVAATAVGVAMAPLAGLGFQQRGQISWLTKPGLRTVYDLFVTFAGSKALIVPIAALALCGAAAGVIAWPRPLTAAGLASTGPADARGTTQAAGPAAIGSADARQASQAAGPATLAIVTLPWLIAPPVILLVVSRFKPAYDVRYVFYCQPALALLCAAGLAWLARVIALALPSGRGRQALAWLPSAGIVAVLAALLVSPQQAVRRPASRADNLRYISAVVAAHGRPTDIVFYIPWNMRSLGMGYPGPFRRLRDIALEVSPVESNTLLGTEVSLATLRHRLHDVSRVWLVTAVSQKQLQAVTSPEQRAELALMNSMRLIGRWHANADVLSLYTVK